MPDPERKLDVPLSLAYRAWLQDQESSPDAGISVSLSFDGDLSQIEGLGFETHTVLGDLALGVVHFRDIPALTENDSVLWIAVGESPERTLDTAVRDTRARATAPINGPPVDGLWHADVSSGALTKVPRGTGRGVIVAVIDTGIDFTHPMFMSQRSPTWKTRILRIWDMGLTPATVNDCPPVRLLASANTYGVEYDTAEIEAHLNGGQAINHRDCDGHGTHVAGIAAGGTVFGYFGDATYVGVAPEADIIAVRYLYLPEKIYYKLPNGSVGPEVTDASRFADAVLYCLRTARELGKSVVINMSFGDGSLPGDGLDDRSRLVDSILDPAHADDDVHFPTRAAVVKSAGNDGVNSELVGRIEVPLSGEIVVPFALVDARDGMQTDWRDCQQRLHKPDLSLNFWYARPAAPLSVRFAVRLPHNNMFSADVSAGGKLELGINPIVGPPRNDIIVAFAPNIHRITIEHKDMPAVPHPAGGTVQRQHVRIFVGPKFSMGRLSYHEGIYEVRIKAPAGTIIFVKGRMEFWNAGAAVFRMNPTLQNGTDRHTNIRRLADSTILDPLGRHVITVASYSEIPDPFDGPTTAQGITSSSSRGPLRDYSNPSRPPIAVKPDIAAPGDKITSADTRHKEDWLQWPWWYWGLRFIEHGGTSMSAPMVAGTIALMFEKNPNLNVTQIRTALSTTTRAAVEPSAAPHSTNAYGVGRLDTMRSHQSTP